MLAEAKAKLFVVLPVSDSPAAAALSGFVRTLANEFPAIEFRRVEIVEATSAAAERLASIVLSDSAETDFRIDADGVRVMRLARLGGAAVKPTESEGLARRLEKGPEGGLDNVAWRSRARRDPGANEVEIEVVATGLNFRDVMWALSILPDEMLEDGYAGPTLGLEFAGRVVRVGASVARLKPSDEVVLLTEIRDALVKR